MTRVQYSDQKEEDLSYVIFSSISSCRAAPPSFGLKRISLIKEGGERIVAYTFTVMSGS
jgi:hypothetical protein